MFGGDRDLDTICSQITPPGVGGVSIVRISGSKSLQLAKLFFKNINELRPRYCYLSSFYSALSQKEIDDVIIVYFKGPNSFTGEDSVEIQCHGSPVIVSEIIENLISSGARVADRGEFSYRAFLNGKIDLVQAESIRDLIHSESPFSAKVAYENIRGDSSREILSIENDLVWCLANIEASIDFSTEDIEIINEAEFSGKLKYASDRLNNLIQSYKSNRLISRGYNVIICGSPNVGKSSLLNKLLKSDRAIVTPVAGTTRDLIKERLVFKDVLFNFVDTAGIRSTNDQVELIGINMAKQSLLEADILLVVVDPREGFDPFIVKSLEDESLARKVVYFFNKSDLVSANELQSVISNLRNSFPVLELGLSYIGNLKEGTTARESILQLCYSKVERGTGLDTRAITTERQYESLKNAQSSLSLAIDSVHRSAGSEIIALELKESLLFIQFCLGKQFDDDILDRVFKEFCIGK